MMSADQQAQIQAFIVSWTGQSDNARLIASQLAPSFPDICTIYSNKDDTTETGPGIWVKVPDDYFFGRKFREIAKRFTGTHCFIITADVSCHDWLKATGSLRAAIAQFGDDMGVWSPKIDHSGMSIAKNELTRVAGTHYKVMTYSDSIVWCLSKELMEKMMALDFECNNLGWGVDRAASLITHAQNKLVVFDDSVEINHPPSRGYSNDAAKRQLSVFFRQIPWSVKLHGLYLTRALRRFPMIRSKLYALVKPARLVQKYLQAG